MTFDRNQNGKFRANENASGLNAIRLVHPSEPGTPEIDTVTISTVAMDNTVVISGITYTGRDGVSQNIQFSEHDIPSGRRDTYQVPGEFIDAGSPDLDPLRKAIRDLIELHEVNPEVKVEYTGNPTDELVVTHVGSGTLEGLIVDQISIGTAQRDPIP